MTEPLTKIKPFPALDANTVSYILKNIENELIIICGDIKWLDSVSNPITIITLRKHLADHANDLLRNVQDIIFDIDAETFKFEENLKVKETSK